MGDKQEREMVNELEAAGHGAMRLAASGGGGDHELPDVFCCVDGDLFAIEEKYRTTKNDHTRCYIQEDEVDALMRFCRKWGAIPVLAARFSTRFSEVDTADHFMCHPTEVPRTDSGTYKVHHDIVRDFPTFGSIL